MRYRDLLELKAYHGSGNEHSAFDTKHTGHNSHTFGAYDSTRHGIFFTTTPEFASMYGDVHEYDLDINNTADLDNSNVMYDFVNSHLDAHEDRNIWSDARGILYSDTAWGIFEDEVGERFVAYLKQEGYDSATFEEYNTDDDDVEHKSNTIVVLNPSKVTKHGQLEFDLYETWIEHYHNGQVRPAIEKDGRKYEPDYLYRVMSKEEYLQAEKEGVFRGNPIIHASEKPDMNYANDPNAVVVRFIFDEADDWRAKWGKELYAYTWNKVPFDRGEII